MFRSYSMELAGRTLTAEIGRVAEQANGACLMRYGDTTVLVTATASDKPREGIDFFPLSIDYEERLYSVGKIPGGFIKREGRPSEKAVLTARCIDRPLRPLFPKDYRNDVSLVNTVLCVDQDCSPEILAMVDDSKIAFRPAVELSYLAEKEQRILYDAMGHADCTPSLAQAIKMKSFSREDKLSEAVIRSIMAEEKPNQKEQFRIPKERISKYFKPGTPARTMEDTIIKALDYYRKRQREIER